MTTPTPNYYRGLIGLGVDETLAEAAAEVLLNNKPYLLATTGKLASGKDTIAPAVLEHLGASDVFHLSFANALKDELNDILKIAREAPSERSAVDQVVELGVRRDEAQKVIDLVRESAIIEPDTHSRQRTMWVRTALQYWGTGVRREQDSDFWVKRTAKPAAQAIAEGRNIMVTDVRFPNEVMGSQALGFTVVRLEITEETQDKRLWERDKLVLSPEQRLDASEVALDGYEGFDLVIDNNGTIDEGVQKVLHFMRTKVLTPA